MKKLLACFFAGLSMTSAYANFEELVYARVVTVEPLTQTVYHRVPQTSCTVIETNGTQTRNCQTYQDNVYNQRITGYRVKFEYKGGIHTVLMKTDPGHQVTLKAVTRIYAME